MQKITYDEFFDQFVELKITSVTPKTGTIKITYVYLKGIEVPIKYYGQIGEEAIKEELKDGTISDLVNEINNSSLATALTSNNKIVREYAKRFI